MKKRLFMFATAALMLAACSNDGEVAVNDGAAQLQSGSGVVAFDTYTSSATKAGDPGVQTTATLQLTDKGFGVFSTYTDAGDYDPAAAKPNFMYNQHVHWTTAGGWTYSPLKYWPNETVHDSQSPAAEGPSGVLLADKLTFFAYAPYVTKAAADADAASGTGIIGMSANNYTGDPTISYKVAPLPENSVDLLWGVVPAGGLSYKAASGQTINRPEGLPLLNLLKPDKDQKMKFLFKHALSRIGLKVVGAFDQISAGGSKDANTKITVDQIEIYGTDQLGVSGVLNLNNTSAGVARWTTVTRATGPGAVFTIANSVLNTTINDRGTAAFATQPEGVTATEKNVFEDATKYFMVIPTGNTDITVKITYYVQTKDDNLAVVGGVDGSRIKNEITKTITVNLENNKAYNLKLILGLTSVKLDAEVADWKVDGSTEVYLPQNTAN